MPFTTREERGWAGKTPRPTDLSSKQIKTAWQQRIKDEAVFGARITYRAYLDALKKRLGEVIGGTLTPQQAEERLKTALRDFGYTSQAGFGDGKVPPAKPMSIQDLSSSQRIQLIIDTNVKRARSMGQVAASENPFILMSMPAWKLTRTGARKKPRGNWRARWAAAGAKCGWKGAARKVMCALKTSPIWQALADGAGGFEDTLGSPYPPFAFGSGMAWVNVRRSEWKKICAAEGIPDGLDDITEKAKELKSATSAKEVAPSKPQKVDVNIPAEISKPQGASNPIMTPPKPTPLPSMPSAYTPDFTERDEANDAIDEAFDAISACYDEVAAAAAKLPASSARRLSLEAKLIELSSLKGRVVNYGSAIETTPKPRDAREQKVYDGTMSRYAASAGLTAKRAEGIAESTVPS